MPRYHTPLHFEIRARNKASASKRHFVLTRSPSLQTSFAYNMGIHIICSVLLIFYDFFMLHRLMLSSETLIVVLLALLIHPLTRYVQFHPLLAPPLIGLLLCAPEY